MRYNKNVLYQMVLLFLIYSVFTLVCHKVVMNLILFYGACCLFDIVVTSWF